MDIEKIGLFIKELRNEKKLTQKELAEKLNITDRAISKWERGKGLPDISYLEDLSKIFEVSILEILKGERSNEIHKEDILYSVEYGSKLEKEKTYEVYNRLLNIIIISIMLIVVAFNCRNIYHYYKTYQFNPETDYNVHVSNENIKYDLEKIEFIRNNKGIIFTEDEYQKILLELKTIEKYLKEKQKEDFYGEYKREDLNATFPQTLYISNILMQHDKNILKNHYTYYGEYNAALSTYDYFYNKMIENTYMYKVDEKNYIVDYLQSIDYTLDYLTKLLDLIIEVGELNE